jgi:glucosyl-3-phosphoglycerate synthase
MLTQDWFRTRSFTLGELGCPHELGHRKQERGISVSLVLPTANVASTITSVLGEIDNLRAPGIELIDQVIVVDADSDDGTAELAAEFDVEVWSENELLPEYGPALGKGDAMWRALSRATGDIVAFADTDTANFTRRLVTGVVGCLIARPEIQFAKAAYRRPFTTGATTVPDGGGRVTELAAKPVLNLFFPELAGFVQPLAGEFAGTRELLYSVPFLSGYAVEICLLIDVFHACGLDGMAQVDVGMRKNRHQELGDLSRMGYSVLRGAVYRALRLKPAGDADYLHAVASLGGLELDQFPASLAERPPMRDALAAIDESHLAGLALP